MAKLGLHELTGSPRDYDHLLTLISEAHFVLIGEASHGTHEARAWPVEHTAEAVETYPSAV